MARWLWPIVFWVVGVAMFSRVAPTLAAKIGGQNWHWIVLATLIITVTVASRHFQQSLQRDVKGCFYCWLTGVVVPWVLLLLASVLSFSGAQILITQGAILALIALFVMAARWGLLLFSKTDGGATQN